MEYIPKTFWHAASICMIVTTFGLLFIANKSATVSVQIANTKIDLQRAITTTTTAKEQTQETAGQLEKMIRDLQGQFKAMTDSQIESSSESAIGVPEIDPSSLESELSKIRHWQKSLESLDVDLNAAQTALE